MLKNEESSVVLPFKSNLDIKPEVKTQGAIKKVPRIGHRRVDEDGDVTYKKIQSSQIMGSIQLGIQFSIGSLASKPERDLLVQDFATVESNFIPSQGLRTPSHRYSDFKFKTYSPLAFRYFRELFGIQPGDYMIAMCTMPFRELSNPGASGSIFYLTNDDEFIIKTVLYKEGKFLQELLSGYFLNLNQNPKTLLPKYFGLYCYKCNGKKVRLVAMNNILPSAVRLHQKYDLKGSTYNRKANESELKKITPTYKDMDFIEHHPKGIFLEAGIYNALVKTLRRDCLVLESFKIMDYSLLLGVYNMDEAKRKHTEANFQSEPQIDNEDQESRKPTRISRQRVMVHTTAMESIQVKGNPIYDNEDLLDKDRSGGIPAWNARGERLLLFLGIIDILQSYRLRKKLEHTWKSMIHDGNEISVHQPDFYAKRFIKFMTEKVFMKKPTPTDESSSKRKNSAETSKLSEKKKKGYRKTEENAVVNIDQNKQEHFKGNEDESRNRPQAQYKSNDVEALVESNETLSTVSKDWSPNIMDKSIICIDGGAEKSKEDDQDIILENNDKEKKTPREREAAIERIDKVVTESYKRLSKSYLNFAEDSGTEIGYSEDDNDIPFIDDKEEEIKSPPQFRGGVFLESCSQSYSYLYI